MIVCCGEALIDLLPRRLAGGEEAYLPVAGGALFNTAIALGRLGEDAGFVSGISSDLFGEKLIGALRDSGVDTSLCIRSDNLTTLAFVALQDGQARYTFYDENSAGRMIEADDLPELPASVDALHFGGISLIAQPCASTLSALLSREAASTIISIDPNIRPGFIVDEADYRARLDHMMGLADIVKVSDEDLDWLAQDRPPDALIGEWLEGSAKLVVVTQGAEGAQAHNAAGSVRQPAIAAEVVDTVGAGDTFNAGLLAGLRQANLLDKKRLADASPEQLRPSLELAARVAAHTVGRQGADPPWRHDLDASPMT